MQNSKASSEFIEKSLSLAVSLSANSVGYKAAAAPIRKFYRISQASPKMRILTDILHKILVPLYGSQKSALEKIRKGEDRICYLLCEDEVPVGVIVFKTVLSNEFISFGIRKSIEIKSLFVVSAENNSGRGLGSTLLNKVIVVANSLQIGHEGFHVTVSETKPESLNFFRRKGFYIVHQWIGRYIKGTAEYLLSRQVGYANDSLTIAHTVPIAEEGNNKQPLFVIDNVHYGDIHSLMRLPDGTFISGSKDNSLCKWNKEGKLVRIVHEPEPTEISPKDWITATTVINDEYWIHGERNGRVCIWNTAGDYVRTIKPKLPKTGHKSLEYNTRRVNCLAAGLDKNKPSFFIGFPTVFDEFNLFENRTVATTFAHNNDWVFCIHPLSSKRLLSVVAGDLALWEKTEAVWKKSKTYIEEGLRIRGAQRPFISSLTPRKSSPHQFGLGVFDSSVRIFDLEREKVVNHWKEHRGRIWKVEAISPNLFASSAEDETIKFWDPREKASVDSIDGHNGQVTSLLNLDDHLLIAGSCPENALSQNIGARLSFYDTRV